MKKVAKVIVISALVASPLYSHAWNIICGVSVLSFKASTMDTKWEADSAAIRGLSDFYAGVAELQGINIEILLSTSDKKSAETSRVTAAIAKFKSSNDQLAVAQSKAVQLIAAAGPADSMGSESIAMWKQLADRNSMIVKSLEQKELPDLETLHTAIDLTTRISNLGMRASLLHLGQHKTHHTTGGAAAKF
jgi:hypothetical protein